MKIREKKYGLNPKGEGRVWWEPSQNKIWTETTVGLMHLLRQQTNMDTVQVGSRVIGPSNCIDAMKLLNITSTHLYLFRSFSVGVEVYEF